LPKANHDLVFLSFKARPRLKRRSSHRRQKSGGAFTPKSKSGLGYADTQFKLCPTDAQRRMDELVSNQYQMAVSFFDSDVSLRGQADSAISEVCRNGLSAPAGPVPISKGARLPCF